MRHDNPTLEEAERISPLARAVLSQLEPGSSDPVQSCIDAAEHGADSGFSGFIYHDECRDFVQRNKPLIVASLRLLAEDTGDDVVTMVQNFNCLGKAYSTDEISSVIYGDGSDAGDDANMIYSALAWYALEEVGNDIINNA